MPLPQPDRNVELVEIVTEGFTLINNTMVAIVAEIRSIGIGFHTSVTETNKAISELEEFVNG
jgi:hypothetical protein